MQHGLACSIALDLKDANGSQGGLALELEGFSQLRQGGLGLIEIFLSFFGVDAGEQFDLLHFKFGFSETVFRLLDGGFVLGAIGVFFGYAFDYLLIEVVGL